MYKETISATDFKARCLALLDGVALSGRSLTITKRGKVVAQLVSASPNLAGYPQDALYGTVHVIGDVVKPALAPDEVLAEEGLL